MQTKIKIEHYLDEYILTIRDSYDQVRAIMSFDNEQEVFDYIKLNTHANHRGGAECLIQIGTPIKN